MVWGGIVDRVKSQLSVVEGNMTEEGTGIRSSSLL